MSGENISITGNNHSKNGKTAIKPKVDINILLNKVRAEKKKEQGINLHFALRHHVQKFPTPRACTAMSATITPESSWKDNRFPNLETVVGRMTWPTPNAWDGARGPLSREKMEEGYHQITLVSAVKHTSSDSGALNPDWVEHYLMGYPRGWTNLQTSPE